MLTLEDIRFLQTSRAHEALASLAGDTLKPAQTLTILTRLRKTFTPNEAAALLETAQNRQKAHAKFGESAQVMLFTADALEQASDPLVRAYRAGRVGGRVLDVCCGIGADSLAMASVGHDVLGLDWDEVRVAIATHNAQVLGINARFEVRDVTTLQDTSGYDALFFDPARRDADGKRLFDPEAYQPPLSIVKGWHIPTLAVKLAPSLNLADVEAYGRALEYISVKGDMKEAVLWRTPDNEAYTQATLLTEGGAFHWRVSSPSEAVDITPPRAYLHEPDASLLRANAVQHLAHALNATMIDSTIAYLTSDAPIDSVWVRSWRVLEWMPFQLKRLKSYVRERGYGQITVKKRGFPMLPEEVLAQLKPKGQNACTLFMTRHRGQPVVIVCE